MAVDVTSLEIQVKTDQVAQAEARLKKFSETSRQAGVNANNLKGNTENLDGRLRQTGDAANKASTGLGRMGGAASGASTAMRSLTTVFAGFIGIAAGFRAISSLGRFFSVASQTSKEFQQSIANLSSITGATGQDLAFLSEKSKEFGVNTTLSATQAAEAFQLIASAKPDLLENAQALAVVTEEAIALAEATGATLPEAADTLGSSLNQFGAGAEEASRFINVLAAGAQKGASVVRDTAEALKFVGTVASSIGISFEDTNAALQTLSTVALKGSEAGSGLRQVLLTLEKQTNSQFKPSVVGLTQALQNLKQGVIEGAVKPFELFQARSVVVGSVLIDQVEQFEKLGEAITGTGTAYDQQATRTGTLDGETRALSSAMEGLRIKIGTDLEPTIREATKSTTEFVRALTNILEQGDATPAKVSSIVSGLRLLQAAAIGVAGEIAIADDRLVNFLKRQGAINTEVLQGLTGDKSLSITPKLESLSETQIRDFEINLVENIIRIANGLPTIKVNLDAKPINESAIDSAVPAIDNSALTAAEATQRQLETAQINENAALLESTAKGLRDRRQIIIDAAKEEIDALNAASIKRVTVTKAGGDALNDIIESQEKKRTELIADIEAKRDAALSDLGNRESSQEAAKAARAQRDIDQRKKQADQEIAEQQRANDVLAALQISAIDDRAQREEAALLESQARKQRAADKTGLDPSVSKPLIDQETERLQEQLRQRELEAERQHQIALLALRSEGSRNNFEQINLATASRLITLEGEREQLELTEEQYQAARLGIVQNGNIAIQNEEDRAANERLTKLRAETNERIATQRQRVGQLATIFEAGATLSGASEEKLFNIRKAGAIAQIAINTAQNISDALTAGKGNPVLGAALAAAAGAAQAAIAAKAQSITIGSGTPSFATGGNATGSGASINNAGSFAGFNDGRQTNITVNPPGPVIAPTPVTVTSASQPAPVVNVTPVTDTPAINVAASEINVLPATAPIILPSADAPSVSVTTGEISVQSAPLPAITLPSISAPSVVVNNQSAPVTPAQQPAVVVPAIDAPAITVNAPAGLVPVINLTTPNIELPDVLAPTVNVAPPQVNVPPLDIPASVVNVAAATVNVAPPTVDVPQISVPASVVDVSAPNVSVSQAPITVLPPVIPASIVNVSSPTVNVIAADVPRETLVNVAAAEAPIINLPASVVNVTPAAAPLITVTPTEFELAALAIDLPEFPALPALPDFPRIVAPIVTAPELPAFPAIPELAPVVVTAPIIDIPAIDAPVIAIPPISVPTASVAVAPIPPVSVIAPALPAFPLLPEFPSAVNIAAPELTVDLPSFPNLPEYPTLPTFPELPEFPLLPGFPPLPEFPAIPAIAPVQIEAPSLPEFPDLPPFQVPDIPAISVSVPEIPGLPPFPTLPEFPQFPQIQTVTLQAPVIDAPQLPAFPTIPAIPAIPPIDIPALAVPEIAAPELVSAPQINVNVPDINAPAVTVNVASARVTSPDVIFAAPAIDVAVPAPLPAPIITPPPVLPELPILPTVFTTPQQPVAAPALGISAAPVPVFIVNDPASGFGGAALPALEVNINYTGDQPIEVRDATINRTEDGRQIVNLIISTIANDFADDGDTIQILKNRLNLNDVLGDRA